MKNTKRSKGYTYVEMLTALAVLSILMVPLLPLLSQAAANHRAAVVRHHATREAEALAAEVRRASTSGADVDALLAQFNAQSAFVHTLSRFGVDAPEFSAPTHFVPLFQGSTRALFRIETFDTDGNFLASAVSGT